MTETPDLNLYRPNVGLAMFHREGLVFIGRRFGAAGPYQWQMPQGGMDPGETPAQAALRELEEEIGVTPDLVDILEETDEWMWYDFPPELRNHKRTGRFRGQKQKWFAFRFKGRDSDIRLDAHDREFSDWRWAPLESVADLVIPFKRATYEAIAQRFKRYT
jgi:putative (di)nucleoside polyphosphate hydrolase